MSMEIVPNLKYKQEMKERIVWIDIAKGIVIMLMVLGHSSIPKLASDWIFSFHMPFFFIISGVTTRWEMPVNDFIRHKAAKLMIPFFFYSIVNLLFFPLHGDGTILGYSIYILKNGWGGIALWFVPVLFVALVIMRIIKGRYEFVYVSSLLLLGGAFSKHNVVLPWTLSTVPIAVFWIYFGKVFRLSVLNLGNIKQVMAVFLFVVCFLLGGWLSTLSRTDLASNAILPLYITLPAAALGFIMVCIGSNWIVINRNLQVVQNIVATIGRHTFEILAFSQVIIMVINVNIPNCNVLLKYTGLVIALWVFIYSIQNIKKIYHRIVR